MIRRLFGGAVATECVLCRHVGGDNPALQPSSPAVPDRLASAQQPPVDERPQVLTGLPAPPAPRARGGLGPGPASRPPPAAGVGRSWLVTRCPRGRAAASLQNVASPSR